MGFLRKSVKIAVLYLPPLPFSPYPEGLEHKVMDRRRHRSYLCLPFLPRLRLISEKPRDFFIEMKGGGVEGLGNEVVCAVCVKGTYGSVGRMDNDKVGVRLTIRG